MGQITEREVIQMLKSSISTSAVDLNFRIGETTVRDIKKKEAELDRYEITFGSLARQRKVFRHPTHIVQNN